MESNSTALGRRMRRWGTVVAAAGVVAASVLATSAGAQAATKHSVGLRITSISSATPVVAGAAITVSGKASANLVGKRVFLQRYLDGAWRATGSPLVVPQQRRFTITARAGGLGSVKYRLHSSATARLKAGSSDSSRVLTAQWFYLDALTAVNRSKNFQVADGVQVAAVFRKKNVASLWEYGSFGGWRDGYAEYNLSGRCSAFETTAGVNDTAGSKTQWDFTTIVDGAETDWGYAGLNKPVAVHQDVTGGFRLRVENARIDGDPYQDFRGDAVWADAKILCTAKP